MGLSQVETGIRLSRVETRIKFSRIVVIEYEKIVGFLWWKKVITCEKRYLSYAEYPLEYADKHDITLNGIWFEFPEMLIVRGDVVHQLDAWYEEYTE